MSHPYSLFSRKSLRTIVIVVGSMSAAFWIGIKTAGDVKPLVSELQAGATTVEGDFNHNGHVDLGDVHIALELAQGYRTPTPDELAADPNKDFVITTSDALTIVEKLEHLSVSSTPQN